MFFVIGRDVGRLCACCFFVGIPIIHRVIVIYIIYKYIKLQPATIRFVISIMMKTSVELLSAFILLLHYTL